MTIIVSYMSYKTREMVVDVAKKDKVDIPMLSGVLEVSLRVVMVKLLTPYLAFRGVALAEVSAWIGAWIMLMITYWIYQERTDSFR